MSGACEAWAWTVHGLKPSEKNVLVFLARKAYYDDGQAAWPALASIADACCCNERTVRRALDCLVAKGYLEPGDQDFSAHNPRTGLTVRPGHRCTVWNVVMRGCPVEIEPEDIEEPDGTEPVQAAEERPGAEACEEPDAVGEGPDSWVDIFDSDKMSTHPEADSRVDILTGKVSKMSTNRQITNKYPSAPTGHPPTGGSTGSGFEAGADPPELDADAGRLCDRFRRLLADAGLPVPGGLQPGADGGPRSKRELHAARGLLDAHGPDLSLAVAEWALRRPGDRERPGAFSWRSCVTGPAKLLQKWDKIGAQMADDPQGRRLIAQATPGVRPEHPAPARREASEAAIMAVLVRLDFDDGHYPAAKKHVVAGLRDGLADERIVADWQAEHQGEGGPPAEQRAAATMAGGYHFAGNLRAAEGGGL
jgi:hypothetical protein